MKEYHFNTRKNELDLLELLELKNSETPLAYIS